MPHFSQRFSPFLHCFGTISLVGYMALSSKLWFPFLFWPYISFWITYKESSSLNYIPICINFWKPCRSIIRILFLSNWHGNYNSLAAFSWGNMPMSWWILLKHGWSFVKRNTCWNNIILSNNQLNDITMKQLLLILR